MTAFARDMMPPDAGERPSEAASYAVRVRALCHSFDPAGGTLALEGIDLDVRTNEFLCIVGHSGCGKTTLLNIVAGFEPHSGGSVTLLGKEVDRVQSGRVGFMFARDNLLPWRTALDNVAFPLEARGVKRAEREAEARRLLGEVGLGAHLAHYPDQLSHGMRQRVAVARTLAMHGGIILMDEPFGALDAQTRIEMQELLASIWAARQRTVILITHDLVEAVSLADRVVVMGGAPGRIVSEYRVPFPRPRSVAELSKHPEYGQLLETLWDDVKRWKPQRKA